MGADHVRFLEGGWLEVTLAGMLAGVALLVGFQMGNPLTLTADLAASIAAAATWRWPRTAAFALAVVVCVYFWFPPEWVTLGEYAPLVPILGLGIRGMRRERALVSGGFLLLLTGLQFHDYPNGGLLVLLGGLVWAVLMAVLWLVGDLFTALRRAQAESERSALSRQRITLAQDLHDTVARSLSRVSMSAIKAEQSGSRSDIDQVIQGLHLLGTELRWVMNLLRDQENPSRLARPAGSLRAAALDVAAALDGLGFATTVAFDGCDPERVPALLTRVLQTTMEEAAANVERHGEPGRPCAILITIEADSVDLVMINQVKVAGAGVVGSGVGLVGVRERVAQVGGRVSTQQEGKQWVLRITVPMPATRSA